MKAAKPVPLLGSLELEVMKVVWNLGNASVSEVVGALGASRRLHHNTVMTVLNRLVKKGFLERHERDGRSHGFSPRISREEASRTYLEVVTRQLFDGSVSRAAAGLLGLLKLPASRSRQLKDLLEELEAEEK